MHCLGIDGCKEGWVIASYSPTNWQIEVVRHLADYQHYHTAQLIFVDMPMGLLAGNKEQSNRACDAEARKLLPKQASSVFAAPARPLLATGLSYPQASALSHQLTGKKISKQSFFLIPKIRELDTYLQQNPSLQQKTYESHPELAFRHFAQTNQPLPSKKTGAGAMERLQLLHAHSSHFNTQFIDHAQAKAAFDDIQDAMSLALYAHKALQYGFRTLPQPSPTDACGIRMGLAVVEWFS